MDDAPSDNEGEPDIGDIGKGVLKQPVEIITVHEGGEKFEVNLGSPDSEAMNTDSEWSDEDYLPLASLSCNSSRSKNLVGTAKRSVRRNWKHVEPRLRAEKLRIRKTMPPNFVQEIIDKNLQPVDIFKIFFTEKFMEHICNESQKYAIFKGHHDFTVSVREMYVYIGILLLSGYCKVPFRRMYWETKSDAYNSLVSNSMSRDRFEVIHRFFHLNDNNTIDTNNKMYKVSPLIQQINSVSQRLAEPLSTSFSVDEAMEPYYGHSSLKQFIRGKPIRYGFKFWCLTTSEGYLLKFDPYCGAGDKTPGKTLGSSVTETLCLNYLPNDSFVFLDNFFNSLPLLQQLKAHKINCIGTIRSDRVEKAPVKNLQKCERGSINVLRDLENGITLTRWHDNNQVTVGTNIDNDDICLTKGTCRRWSKSKKAYVQIDQPSLVNVYNQGMGGVDLFDKQRGLYRTRIRSRKWYWPYIRFCLNGSVVNMWLLYRYVHPKVTLLQFIRRIVLSLLTSPPYLHGPKPKCSKKVLQEIRYDKTDHLIDKQGTQRRCGHCGKCTMFSCLKCNVGLHPDGCFRIYHTP